MVALPVVPAAAQIIEDATTPRTPVSPNPIEILAVAFAAGFCFGCTAIALRQLLKSKISNREELQRYTDIPFIANIENLGKKEEYISEPFNNLCTKMLLMNQFAKTQVITVTSTQRGEGKTTVAHNLARALAQLDKRVLMIDMNSVNPSLDNIFDVRTENTIADIYNNTKDLHEAISITSIPNVDLLKAGQLKSGINTFLTSAKTGAIIDDAKNHYDAVIFDTPEVSNYMDAIPLMKISDLNLYVVKANATSQSLLTQASVIKKDYNINNLFFVLNAIKQTRNHSGGAPTGSFRVLKAKQQAANEVAFVPRMLKKAALWFY
jgi:capsular exopolysaccharide synthesis family protein